MDPLVTKAYRRAYAEASAKGTDMPCWMLRRCVTHSVRLATTPAYRGNLAMHESAWGSADGFADEIAVRRARPIADQAPS